MDLVDKTVSKPFKVIDLVDYVDKKLFTYDWGDFWFDTEGLKTMKEVDSHSFPETKFPHNFTEEDRLKCINEAYHDAEEQSYMSDYIDKFHDRLLSYINDESNHGVSFEYAETCWDSIKLKVYYGIEFLTEEVKDDEGNNYDIEQWLENGFVDFKEAIKRTKSYMKNYQAHDGTVFDEVYMEKIKDSIWEVKKEKLSLYKQIQGIMNSHISKRKKIVKIIKTVQGG